MAIQPHAIKAGTSWASPLDTEDVHDAQALLAEVVKALKAADDKRDELKRELVQAERDARQAQVVVARVTSWLTDSLLKTAEEG